MYVPYDFNYLEKCLHEQLSSQEKRIHLLGDENENEKLLQNSDNTTKNYQAFVFLMDSNALNNQICNRNHWNQNSKCTNVNTTNSKA